MFAIYFLVLAGLLTWHALGISVGLHRLLTHRSFKTPKWLEYFLVAGGYLSWQGSPIFWVASHRTHHKFVDTPKDPHGPTRGIFYGYLAWAFEPEYAENCSPKLICRELINDPVYKFLDCGGNRIAGHLLNMVFVIGFRVLLGVLFGWQIALVSVISFFINHNAPLITNTICHLRRAGVRTYDTHDDSSNVWWLAVFCVGEGWHNNHHAYPASARSGFKPHELDFSWFFIKCLAKVGLATHVRESIKSGEHFELARTRALNLESLAIPAPVTM